MTPALNNLNKVFYRQEEDTLIEVDHKWDNQREVVQEIGKTEDEKKVSKIKMI
jgi:hypothetical protein